MHESTSDKYNKIVNMVNIKLWIFWNKEYALSCDKNRLSNAREYGCVELIYARRNIRDVWAFDVTAGAGDLVIVSLGVTTSSSVF